MPEAVIGESEADAQTLLGYIHTSYLMTIGREKAIRDLKRWLLMRFWMFLFWLTVALALIWLILKTTQVLEAYGAQGLLAAHPRSFPGRGGRARGRDAERDPEAAARGFGQCARGGPDHRADGAAHRQERNQHGADEQLGLRAASLRLLPERYPETLGLRGGIFPTPAIAATRRTRLPRPVHPAGDGRGGKRSGNAPKPRRTAPKPGLPDGATRRRQRAPLPSRSRRMRRTGMPRRPRQRRPERPLAANAANRNAAAPAAAPPRPRAKSRRRPTPRLSREMRAGQPGLRSDRGSEERARAARLRRLLQAAHLGVHRRLRGAIRSRHAGPGRGARARRRGRKPPPAAFAGVRASPAGTAPMPPPGAAQEQGPSLRPLSATGRWNGTAQF